MASTAGWVGGGVNEQTSKTFRAVTLTASVWLDGNVRQRCYICQQQLSDTRVLSIVNVNIFKKARHSLPLATEIRGFHTFLGLR